MWSHEHWKEGNVQVRQCTSKEKQWTIVWHVIGTKRYQMLQMPTHGKTCEFQDAAGEFMIQLATRYATDQATTKESMEKSKADFLALTRPAQLSAKQEGKEENKNVKVEAVIKRPSAKQEATQGQQGAAEDVEEHDEQPEDETATDVDIPNPDAFAPPEWTQATFCSKLAS